MLDHGGKNTIFSSPNDFCKNLSCISASNHPNKWIKMIIQKNTNFFTMSHTYAHTQYVHGKILLMLKPYFLKNITFVFLNKNADI